MELKSLFCPNCGANLEVEDGRDTFFCKYYGYKILFQGQSKAVYEAKVRIKHVEHNSARSGICRSGLRHRWSPLFKKPPHGKICFPCGGLAMQFDLK